MKLTAVCPPRASLLRGTAATRQRRVARAEPAQALSRLPRASRTTRARSGVAAPHLASVMHKMFENMAKGAGGDPFGGQMANAQHLWSFLDELSENNPEEYAAFLKGQMESARQTKPKPTMPEVGFCVRLRTQSGVALLVNVCSHVNIQPPSSTPDGSIPLCVGVPRACEHKGKPAHAVDLLVNGEVLDRATTNAAYREEMAALAADCAKGTLTEARLLPEALKPGYQVLPLHGADAIKYAGTLQPFVDARGPPPGDGRPRFLPLHCCVA